MKKEYRKAIFIATYRKNKNKVFYLLLKRKLHWIGWEFPKGGIEKNEPMFLAVIRELKEETGQHPIAIKSYEISGKYKYDKKYPDRKGFTGQTYKLFSAEIKNKKIIIDKREHSAYKWVGFKTALKILSWPNQKKCLKIINKNMKK